MRPDVRTPVVLVAGWGAPGDEGGPVRVVAADMLGPGTVLVHHDLRTESDGWLRRTVTTAGEATTTVLELAHGCVLCTLREDLLPLLRRLHARADVHRVVLELHPSWEPEAVCWAMTHVVVGGLPGTPDAPALHDVRVEAVLTVLDAGSWLADATGDAGLVERGWAVGQDDERTVAQVVVGQVAMADAVVVSGEAEDAWSAARLGAVLDRLVPGVPRGGPAQVQSLLAAVPTWSRRGRVDDAHAPLLRGEPPLDAECGVQLVELTARRPFHPQRLHHAVDVLLEGVVQARGRLWLASQPDVALWLESAGGALQVGSAGAWLATLAPEDPAWQQVDPQRRALAALRWDPLAGDRDTTLVVLCHEADPEVVLAALREALITDDELAAGQELWATWDDPFEQFHTDPCAKDDSTESAADAETGAAPTRRGQQP